MEVVLPKSLDDVKTLDVLPAGRYRARIMDVEEATSQSGNPMLVWELEVVGGEHSGRKLWARTSKQEQALWKLKEVLTAAGIPWAGARFRTEDALGREMEVSVSVVPGRTEGEKMNSVEKFYPKVA